MSKATQVLNRHFENGVLVTVYAEKKTKKVTWMKGESSCGVLNRLDGEALGGSMVRFSRRVGSY